MEKFMISLIWVVGWVVVAAFTTTVFHEILGLEATISGVLGGTQGSLQPMLQYQILCLSEVLMPTPKEYLA